MSNELPIVINRYQRMVGCFCCAEDDLRLTCHRGSSSSYSNTRPHQPYLATGDDGWTAVSSGRQKAT